MDKIQLEVMHSLEDQIAVLKEQKADLLEVLKYVLRNLDTKPLPKHDIRKHCTEAIQETRES